MKHRAHTNDLTYRSFGSRGTFGAPDRACYHGSWYYSQRQGGWIAEVTLSRGSDASFEIVGELRPVQEDGSPYVFKQRWQAQATVETVTIALLDGVAPAAVEGWAWVPRNAPLTDPIPPDPVPVEA